MALQTAEPFDYAAPPSATNPTSFKLYADSIVTKPAGQQPSKHALTQLQPMQPFPFCLANAHTNKQMVLNDDFLP